MKNVWIIGALAVLGAIGLILGLSGKDVADAGDFSLGYFSAGNFSAGIFSAGIFSAGIFSIGVFSIGIFSVGIFNIGVVALGFFLIAWKKKYAKVHVVPEPETADAK
jgi:quaternary ammonium compound-resistance protein SugE